MFHGHPDVVFRWMQSNSSFSEESIPSTNRGFSKSTSSSSQSPLNLWPTGQSDFILVAEFCELKGPKPVITIPSQFKCRLDLNSFAVRILSVDYQGVESGSCIQVEDTQALLPDVYPGVHAFVHYMTLSDMSARGYARPMCLAYVTVQKRKLVENFHDIRKQFTIASSHFKHGSRILFKTEMEQRLEDLLYTKGCYITHSTQSSTTKDPPEPINDEDARLLNCINLESLQNYIEEAERALMKVLQLIDVEGIDENIIIGFQTILDSIPRKFAKSHLTIIENFHQVQPHTPTLIKPSAVSYDDPLRNIFALSGKHAAIGLYLLFKALKQYTIDCLEMRMKINHTVLPHMEQMPFNVAPTQNTSNDQFWESIQYHPFTSNSSQSAKPSSDSTLTVDNTVSFTSSLEYLNSNLTATIFNLNSKMPGYNIAEVFQKFPCGQHILYTMLMSRLLVVIGSSHSESIVRQIVQALQPLVIPFNCPALIIPWRKESLKATDLGLIQLVGLCQPTSCHLASIIPNSMKHYISILDIDKNIFVGPAYSGTFLKVFEDGNEIDDVSLLSFINSIIYDIVLKTRIYYYHQLEAENNIHYDRSDGCNEDNDQLFFKQMTNSASDISIIKHLAEVMKTETVNKMKSAKKHNSGTKIAQVVRIKHEPISIIKL